MSKHTKGPWRYWTQRRPESEDTCTFVSIDGTEILRAVTKTMTEADARLIAAAPDLLEALEDLLPLLEDRRLQDKVRAVIAKATGEQA
jgi:hypothetical protein